MLDELPPRPLLQGTDCEMECPSVSIVPVRREELKVPLMLATCSSLLWREESSGAWVLLRWMSSW